MSSPSSLSDLVNLNKFNASNPLPVIPDLPPLESFHVQARVEQWINTFPTEGDLRNLSMMAFHSGINRNISGMVELFNSKGNSGALQRILDDFDMSMKKERENTTDAAKRVYSYDKNGKLVTNSAPWCQGLDAMGWHVNLHQIVLRWMDEIVNPPNPSPNPTPQPKPSPQSAKQDAIVWFQKMLDLEVKSGGGNDWLYRIQGDAISNQAKHQLVSPPTPESQYLVVYYQTLVELCEGQIKKTQSEKWWSDFWAKYKWWIVGGAVGVVTIYAIWKIM